MRLMVGWPSSLPFTVEHTKAIPPAIGVLPSIGMLSIGAAVPKGFLVPSRSTNCVTPSDTCRH